MVWMSCDLSNHSPIEGHFGCFQFGAIITSKAATDNHVQVFG